MRKFLSFLMVNILLLTFITVVINPSKGYAQEKQTILVLLTGDTHLTKSTTKKLKDDTANHFRETFAQNYNLLIGDEYIKRLEESGFSDIDSMERADLLNFFKEDKPDFIVVYDFLPFQHGGGFIIQLSSKSSIHLKIIDVNKAVYTANKKFFYDSAWASFNGHYSKIYSDIEKEVFLKQFPLITLTAK